ncbi:vascular endothelial growth factor D isoform X2 [Zootoca vivipara]|uniref:vascular endothelial growth factor D isoform X2 n=1 Tax=Zootoca vivipara TaxID=8524 RepID=UPI00293B9EAC|nr:vascular endothelial growth factor D isoform X2 [Zootoca vivipara]
MYKPWTTVNIFIVSFLHLLQGSEHGSVKRTSLSALAWSEQQIRKAASLEELLRITHSEDWKLWKCRLKLKGMATMDSRSASHRSTRFAAAFYDIEILKVIDEEWQRTQCVPRETCVEVAKELGTATNKFFKPPCVNVYRCGGCCNEESLSCVNTSTSYISKTLFEISVPLTNVPDPIQVKIANHTGCKCLTNAQRPSYAIIRRSVQYPEEDSCPQINKLCHSGWMWDSDKCECVVDKDRPGRREAVKTNVHSKPECAQLLGRHARGTVAAREGDEVLTGPKAEKHHDGAFVISCTTTATQLCKVAARHRLLKQ